MPSPKASPNHSPRRRAGGSPREDGSKDRAPFKQLAAKDGGGSPRIGSSPRAGQKHSPDDEHDEENSLDSDVERKRKAEELAKERADVWRRRRDMVRGICRYVVHVLCSKRRLRRERLKHNRWVNVGDRYERQMEIKTKRQALTISGKVGKKGTKEKKRPWTLKRCCFAIPKLIATILQDALILLREYLGYVDKRTGLPKALLENYTFRQRLHENKHGFVFEAMDSEGKLVAVKIRDKSRGNVFLLPVHQAVYTLWKVGATLRKGRLHALLVRLRLSSSFEHPHLATLYAVFDNPEFYVEVCELMLGPCLATYLEDVHTQLDEVQTCHIFTQVVSALLFLHSRKVLFRDLRLCQIFLTKPMQMDNMPAETQESAEQEHTDDHGAGIQCKLTDYWCCARMRKRHGSMVQKFFPGDIATLSPEVLQYGEWTEKADVWAAGCLLFELLFGHPPYGGAGHALAMRIIKQEPEYDEVCGKLSDSSLILLKAMLSRHHFHRPTMSNVLTFSWFHEFGYKDKGRPDGKTAFKIRNIRIEKAPLYRRGMPPENLLVAQTGMFNAGFCSFMGATSCHIDFEVGGPEEWRLFWVTSIRVGLWGNGDNPKRVIFAMALREGGLYSELYRAEVAGITSSEVEYSPNRPIRHLRLHFRENFQGDFGIAIRKLALLGFEVRPVPVKIDFETAIFQGCELWLHSEEITDVEINHGRIHPTLRNELEKGPRIPGTGNRYWKYQDVYSGSEVGITVIGILLQAEPGFTIVSASLGLRYVAHAPAMATPPRVRITVESPLNGKESLFRTPDLTDSQWGLRDILTNGYEELEQAYIDNLEIPTDDTLLVEIHFDLNSGYLNIPSDFGLTFYYMPNLPTPESEDDAMEINKEELIARRGSSLEDLTQSKGDRQGERYHELGADAVGADGLVAGALKPGVELDEDQLEYEGELREEALKKDLNDLQFLSSFGVWGAGNFDKRECRPLDIWNCPEDIEEGATDLLNKKLWWEGAWSDDYVSSSSEFRSQDGSPRLKEVEPGLYMASNTTTCPASLATPLRSYSGLERSGSRQSRYSHIGMHEDRHHQEDPTFLSPKMTKLDEWGAVDEWEHTPEWMRLEHRGHTDAWGVPLDDKAAMEQDRLERERTRTAKLAEGKLLALRQKTRASADMAVAKLQTSPIGKRLIAMEQLAEQRMHELESSFAGVCRRLCNDD